MSRGPARAAWGLLAAAACTAGLAAGPTRSPSPPPDPATLNYHLKPRAIATNTWVLEGAVDDFSRANGCNIINTGFIATPAGTVVVNTGPSRVYGEQQRKALEALTRQPVVRVLNLNLHPDYFFGNQAWADRPTQALAGSIEGMRAEGAAYEANLFRLCGDWMKGTESAPAREVVTPGPLVLGNHQLELLRLSGHTSDDLVLLDRSTGVLFAGGLVFADRAPTTPHAHLQAWRQSLLALQQLVKDPAIKTIVPSHGPVHAVEQGRARGIEQTLDWLQWLETTLQQSARQGLDLGEVLRLPLPPRFAGWAAMQAEYLRSVTYLYPRYELAEMQR